MKDCKQVKNTDLGTRVKNEGYAYTFLEDALVYHSVDPVSLSSYLKYYKQSQYVPLYIKKHKYLRAKIFWKYFWSKKDLLLILAFFSIPLGLLVWPFLLLLALPYLLNAFLRYYLVTIKMGRPLSLLYRVAMTPFSILGDLITFSYFLIGSARYRCLVI